ncbi:MAG: N-methyl-L-tryptophan oxidase, partial [Myxococcales bacterium]|nr:N-methyl-L-tryptophan oxidase [Myxococcales bacterium]
MADVAVIGLGGMGSATAFHLARRGASVIGFEQFTEAHNLGSSHGDSRVIREAYFEDPAYVPLLRRSYELWADASEASGSELLTLCGGLMIGRPDDGVVAGSTASAREWNIPHEILDADEIRRRWPQMTPAEDQIALFEHRSGFVPPEASVRAHAGLARRAGADLRFETSVDQLSFSSDGVEIEAGGRRWSVEHAVVTAGPWAGRLLPRWAGALSVRRVGMYWFAPDDWQRYRVGRFPVHVWDDAERLRLYGFPAHGDPRGGVKVAFFRAGEVCEPDAVNRRVAPEEIETMRAHLAARVPGLAGECLRATVCLYTDTPDEHFVIGHHPECDRVTV